MQIRDLRVFGLVVFVVVVLMISWSGVKTIETNYRLQKSIAKLKQQVDVAKLSNDNLKLQNQYYNTPQYLELTARENFGLAAPGEVLVNIPKQVALAHTVDLPNVDKANAHAAESKKSVYQRNFEAWIDFLLHRKASIKI